MTAKSFCSDRVESSKSVRNVFFAELNKSDRGSRKGHAGLTKEKPMVLSKF